MGAVAGGSDGDKGGTTERGEERMGVERGRRERKVVIVWLLVEEIGGTEKEAKVR
jgi:hypothetical protein